MLSSQNGNPHCESRMPFAGRCDNDAMSPASIRSETRSSAGSAPDGAMLTLDTEQTPARVDVPESAIAVGPTEGRSPTRACRATQAGRSQTAPYPYQVFPLWLQSDQQRQMHPIR